MKKLVTISAVLLIIISSFSQPADLVINSGAKGQYLTHTVAPKEGLFPIGRLYNVHPRHIANFNGIDFNKGLSIGQSINIPLSDTNFKQTVNTGVPVYYKVAEKETVANISVKSKASVNNLRAWNSLAADNVSAGTKLIIGFLITNEMKDKLVTITPKILNEETSVSNVNKAEAQKKQMETAAKTDAVVRTEGSVSNVNKTETQKKQMEPDSKTDISPKTGSEPSVSNVNKAEAQKKQMESSPTLVKESIADDGTGYFKSNFYQQLKTSPAKKEQTLTSSIFKTTSGWQDGKYYLLINGVEPGTIVKVTNPSNSKVVFAKVLYAMDKIRENQGVDIRISDAAASSLAVSETEKFILKVNY